MHSQNHFRFQLDFKGLLISYFFILVFILYFSVIFESHLLVLYNPIQNVKYSRMEFQHTTKNEQNISISPSGTLNNFTRYALPKHVPSHTFFA